VKTITVPAGAKGVFLDCATNDCRVTFDGTTVSATAGLILKKDNNPAFFPVAPSSSGVQVVSQAAGNSVVDYMFVS
jgi:hypothetical protein